MLGVPLWPPVKETAFALMPPVCCLPSEPIATQEPDAKIVGAPMLNRILTVSSRARALNIASASSVDPSRAPRRVIIFAPDRSSWYVKSSTVGWLGELHAASSRQQARIGAPSRESTIYIRTGPRGLDPLIGHHGARTPLRKPSSILLGLPAAGAQVMINLNATFKQGCAE